MKRKGGLAVGLKSILESTYGGRMTVYKRYTKLEQGRMVEREMAAIENLPCALSRNTNLRRHAAAMQQELLPEVRYDAKIFTSPEAAIPAGCRIVVTQNGVTLSFVTCGEATVYPTHQEITLTREGKA